VNNNKYTGLAILLSSLILLQGCSKTLQKKTVVAAISSNQTISPVNIAANRDVSCIDELRSLTVLSPNDYSKLVSLFKEVSELNQTYKSVQYNANPDSLAILKMTIETKTKVLCAKVKYSSILSVNKKVDAVNVL
jgi:hypothetical protein